MVPALHIACKFVITFHTGIVGSGVAFICVKLNAHPSLKKNCQMFLKLAIQLEVQPLKLEPWVACRHHPV